MHVVAAIEALHGPMTDAHVHEARRSLKRARAELRLVRAKIGETNYRQANRTLRDVGRMLAPWRDSKALLDSCDLIAMKVGDTAPRRLLREIRQKLAAKHLRTNPASRHSRALAARARRRLELLLERSHAWPSGPLDAELLSAAAARIYQHGRKSLAAARKQRTAPALHEWRKQSKYLAEGLASLGAGRGLEIDRLAAKAAGLAQTLGENHDLDLLQARISSAARGSANDATARELSDAIERRRRKLERRAFDKGLRLYERRPSAFALRIGEALLKRQ